MIDLYHFENFLKVTRPFDYDLMLEIKDKEQSALKAVEILLQDDRFLVIPAIHVTISLRPPIEKND